MEDYRDRDDRDRDDMEPYRVERIATVLAVTCMFLSALYTIFAILLFLCYAGEEKNPHHQSQNNATYHHTGQIGDGVASHPKPLVTPGTIGSSVTPGAGSALNEQRQMHPMDMDGGNPGFITMENSSQGTNS